MLVDFNVMSRINERRRKNYKGSTTTREVEGFNNFIETIELLDVPLIGRKYTWYKDNGMANSRIDRILIPS